MITSVPGRANYRPDGSDREPGDGAAQAQLAAALANGVDRNFERFVAYFQDRLYGFILTLTANATEAEELAQDSFVSAYRALQNYDPDRRRSLRLRSWLFTIALNKVRNSARRAPSIPLEDGVVPAARASDEPQAQVEREETVQRVWHALDELAPRYRMPVILRHIQGLSYDEIARVLDQPVGTAKANVHRGLVLLRGDCALGALL